MSRGLSELSLFWDFRPAKGFIFNYVHRTFSVRFPFRGRNLCGRVTVGATGLFRRPVRDGDQKVKGVRLPSAAVQGKIRFRCVVFGLVRYRRSVLLVRRNQIQRRNGLDLQRGAIANFGHVVSGVNGFEIRNEFAVPDGDSCVKDGALYLRKERFVCRDLLCLYAN